MPGFTHPGLDAIDYTPGTVRTDTSDTLLASLYMRPNVLSAMPIGQFGGGGQGLGASAQQLIHSWIEDRVNPRTVTENDGGIASNATSFTVSLSDGALLDVDYVLQDNAQSILTAELVRVTGIQVSGGNAVVTISRAYQGTTAASHPASTVWNIVATPTIQGSDLGRDQSRAPGIKYNYIQTARKDVVITAAMLALAQQGKIPGIANQMAYQLNQRFTEMMLDWESSFIRGIGTPAGTTQEAQTMYGLLAWLGYAAVTPNATSSLYNATGSVVSDTLFNQIALNLYFQGAEIPDAFLGNPYVMDRAGRIYRDQLRLQQAELVRGYLVDAIRVSIGQQPVKLLMSGFMPGPVTAGAQTPTPVVAGVDFDRTSIIPFLDQFCYLISAENFIDGDALSLVMKMTLEVRNSGTDFGQAHQLAYGFTI